MKNQEIETNHNLWLRLFAKACTDTKFKEKLLIEADQVLDCEQKELRKEIIKDILNDPEKMEKIFGDEGFDGEIEMDVMEERLAAFGYIGL